MSKANVFFRGLLRPRFLLLFGLLSVVVLGLTLWAKYGDRVWLRTLFESPYSGRCKQVLTRSVLDRSLELGTRYMLAHQKPEGNFDYEYDWRARTYAEDDNEVRQAGALWGLALLYQAHPTPELALAVEKGLAYFERTFVVGAGDARCVAYPGKAAPGIGTVALVALTYIEYLRAKGPPLPPERRALHEERLHGYLRMLELGVNKEGLWFGHYDPKTCAPAGPASPYSDGEALLALVKAAKYLGHGAFRPLIFRTAEAGYRLNVKQALAEDRDSDTTKGYYQWSSMAFYELATSDWPDVAKFGDHVFELTDWQIDVHLTLTRVRNTGYAYEGIIPAYDLARRRGDAARAAKYACVIDLGLERLISWQVGGPLATSYTADVAADDRLALGGVQNGKDLPGLRIDVTQHQMHATIYARELVYTK